MHANIIPNNGHQNDITKTAQPNADKYRASHFSRLTVVYVLFYSLQKKKERKKNEKKKKRGGGGGGGIPRKLNSVLFQLLSVFDFENIDQAPWIRAVRRPSSNPRYICCIHRVSKWVEVLAYKRERSFKRQTQSSGAV